MRRLVATAAVLSLAALVAGCGKPADQSGEQAPAADKPKVAAPNLEQMKAAQAALPAPYNTADLANGQAKFALCASCHTITPDGPNLTGPHLFGIVGQKAGAVEKYNYSAALKESGIVWDAARLDAWLVNPRAMVPGTKMSFVGMKDPKDRTDMIAYLMVNSAPKPQ